MSAYPDLQSSHKPLTKAFQALAVRKISMQMLLSTRGGSHKPQHPWGNTPESIVTETLSQRERDTAICEERFPHRVACSYSPYQPRQPNDILHFKINSERIPRRRKEEDFQQGRRNPPSSEEIGTSYNFFFPQIQKLCRVKKKDSNIPSFLQIQFRSSLEKFTKQRKRKGGNRDFSFFCLLTVQCRKLLLATMLLYRT